MNLKNKLTKKNIIVAILSIFLIAFAIIQIYPLIWLLMFSLKDNAQIYGGNVMGLPTKFMWGNYKNALTSGNVWLYTINSALVTAVTIVVSGVIGVMASYAIARMKWKLSNITLTIFLLGIMIPIHSALLPLFIILNKTNLLDKPIALIVPYIAYALPMCIFVCVGFLKSIPKEMEESAFLDGCSIYRSFVSIILPLIKPAVATVSIFTYLQAWNELMFASTFINDTKYKTLPVGIMSMSGQYSTEWGPIGAGLVIATIPTIVIYILMSNQVQASLTNGAVKG